MLAAASMIREGDHMKERRRARVRVGRAGPAMTHRGDRTLQAKGIARAESEGAMYVRVGAGQVEAVRHLRAPVFLRGIPGRPLLHGATGHDRANMWNMPGCLPGQRVPCD
jgi:hypothetical protein